MTDLPYRVAELERRLANLLRVGRVEALDAAAARVRVQTGELVTAWLPWVTRRAGPDAEWWAPEAGEQVLLLAPGGDLALGVVLPALYQTAYPAPGSAATLHKTTYADGGFASYDRASGAAELNAVGNVTVTAGGAVALTASDGAAEVTASGTVKLCGGGLAAAKGVVQGDCICAYTGTPHPMVSATVQGSL